VSGGGNFGGRATSKYLDLTVRGANSFSPTQGLSLPRKENDTELHQERRRAIVTTERKFEHASDEHRMTSNLQYRALRIKVVMNLRFVFSLIYTTYYIL